MTTKTTICGELWKLPSQVKNRAKIVRMDDLFSLATITEIAELWGLHPMTVRRALNAKKKPLRARQSGRIILISVESVKARWGLPIRPLPLESLI